MSARYLFRLDDITPCMNWTSFFSLMCLFARHRIKPLLAVVPDNRDPSLAAGPGDNVFWQTMGALQECGAADFAQHGYQHVCSPRAAAGIFDSEYLNGGWSEFTGAPYQEQYAKIESGRNILRSHGINTDYWVAPKHSLDRVTLRALRNLGFRAISDGIALLPFRMDGLIFVPQQLWRPRSMPAGVITICIHPNEMGCTQTEAIRCFLKRRHQMTSFSKEVESFSGSGARAVDAAFRLLYAAARKSRAVRLRRSTAGSCA